MLITEESVLAKLPSYLACSGRPECKLSLLSVNPLGQVRKFSDRRNSSSADDTYRCQCEAEW